MSFNDIHFTFQNSKALKGILQNSNTQNNVTVVVLKKTAEQNRPTGGREGKYGRYPHITKQCVWLSANLVCICGVTVIIPSSESHILCYSRHIRGGYVSLRKPTNYFKFQSINEWITSLNRNVYFPNEGNFMLWTIYMDQKSVRPSSLLKKITSNRNTFHSPIVTLNKTTVSHSGNTTAWRINTKKSVHWTLNKTNNTNYIPTRLWLNF